MEEQDKLYHLIKSLTKNEKIYFKRYAKTHFTGTQNDYLSLFEAISKQHKYDEAKLKRKLKTAHFAATKSYLYKQLIKSLQFFEHRKPSDFKKINNQIEAANILIEKALYKEARKTLENAQSIAEKVGAVYKLIEINQIKIAHYRQLSSKSDYRKELFDERRALNDFFLQEIEYQEVYFDFFDHIQQYSSLRNSLHQEACEHILRMPIFQDVQYARTYSSKNVYYGTRFYYYYFFHEYSKAYIEIKHLEVLHRKEREIEGRKVFDAYLSTLNSWALVCVKLKYFEEILEIIALFQQIKLPNERLEKLRGFYLLQWQSEYYYYTNNLEYIAANLTASFEQIYTNQDQLNNSSLFLLSYNFARTHFVMEDYAATLIYIERAKLVEKAINSTYLKTYLRLLDLLVHYELKHDQYLESAINNAKYFLKKEGTYYEFERLLLNNLIKINNSHSIEHRKLFEQLKEASWALFSNEANDVAFYKEGITIYWIEAKLKEVSIREVISKEY